MAGAQHPGLDKVGGGGSGLQNRVGEQEMVRLEVALEGWVTGGDRATSPPRRVGPTEKCRGPGSSPLTRPPGGGDRRGRGGAGRRMRRAGWSRRTVRPAGARSSRRGPPPRALDPAPGALSCAADRSPQPAGAAARQGTGSGGQDVRAGEYRPPAGTRGLLPRPGLRPRAARCRPNAPGAPGLGGAPPGPSRAGDGGRWGRLPQAGLSAPAFLFILALESRVGLWSVLFSRGAPQEG